MVRRDVHCRRRPATVACAAMQSFAQAIVTPAETDRTFRLLLYDALASEAMSTLTTGVFLTGFALALVLRIVRPRNMASSASGGRRSWSRRTVELPRCSWR
jgi:hypothetical protein